jgi:hypothetical protein
MERNGLILLGMLPFKQMIRFLDLIIRMASIEREVISEIKSYINGGDLDGLKTLWEEYQDTDFGRELAWEYIFEKIYLHAALKKQKPICSWLDILYQQLDPIQQMGLRQMFPYARYLLQKS